MKRTFVLLIAALAVLPALSMGVNLTVFQDGATSIIAGLATPGFETAVNLSLPAECHVKKAVLTLGTAPGNETFPGDPAGVMLSLDGNALWAFNGKGYGALGNQTVFADDSPLKRRDFGPGGGATEYRIRLPKKAAAGSASLTMNMTGDGSWIEKQNWSGGASYDQLGQSVSDAGDVNGDGYDDILAGAPYYQSGGYQCGLARLYLGGPAMNASAYLNFSQTGYSSAEMGFSVSGAGDVNRDGYDDIIVGAFNAYIGGSYLGAAFIYFGGKAMDTTPDAVLRGQSSYDYFGYSVSGAGDFNQDGYDDVIVGAPYNDAAGSEAGRAYIYFGGASMDATADRTFNGSASYDYFGYSVSGAGDVNGDGLADVIVGAYQAGSYDNGMARIFFGDSGSGVLGPLDLTGEANYDRFGYAVSDAGDVNGDGFGDVLVGAPEAQSGGRRPGLAYLFLGGKQPDARPDLVIEGEADFDYFGRTVSGAGDLDLDGCDDFVVGAPYFDVGANEVGKAYAFFGGASPDPDPDLNFTGYASGDYFGASVSGAGDVNSDGHPDLLVGAPYVDGNGYDSGRAYLFSWVPGILAPELVVGARTVLSGKGYINATKTVDCLQAVSEYLSSAIPNGTDPFDNRYVDIPVVLRARSEGRVILDNLSIVYEYETAIPDFGAQLEQYHLAHKGGQDGSGMLSVPLQVNATSGGRLRLSALSVNYDDAPALIAPVPELSLDEDTADPELADLHQFFVDDADPAEALRFSIESATNSSLVALTIENDRYLSADALTGAGNDNWTGAVEVVVACADHWGSRRLSNSFVIAVKNVNDAPVITSLPPTRAMAEEPYIYNVTAADGDLDTLFFKIVKGPAGMTIGSSTGRLEWTPSSGGDFSVTILVEDGKASAQQSFTITVPNRPPRMTSAPPQNAFVGVPLVYNLTAADDDNDTLTYSLLSSIPGMTISAGALSWTPDATGTFSISLQVSDGTDTAYQNFTIEVTQPNRSPRFTGAPPASATAEVPLAYDVRTTDDDGDPVNVTLTSGPTGMALEAAGRLTWTPADAGNFTVVLSATDGKGGTTVQQFTLMVVPATRPVVAITFPSQGQTVEGKAEFSGTVQRGTHLVQRVELRIDGGEWRTANGTEGWRLSVDAGKLRVGSHGLEVRAFDGKGYSEPVSVGFRVERSSVQEEQGLPFMLILLVIIVIVILVALVAALAMRRKKGPVAAPPAQAGAPPVEPAEPGAPPAIPPATPLPPEPPKPPEREFTP